MIYIARNTPDTEKPTLLMDNVFTKGTIAGSGGGDGSTSRLNAINDTTFDYWISTSATSTIVVDAGSAQPCSAVGIAAHTLGTAGATVQVESSTNLTDWTTRLTFSPLTDITIIGVFPEVSAQYWRLRVTNGPASIGVIKLGKRIIVPSGVSLGHVATNHGERVELLSNDSIDGQFLGTRVIRRSGEIDLDFGLVDRSFIDNDFAVFEMMYNEGRAFFYAGGPSVLPRDYGYCKRPATGQEIRPAFDGGDLMSLSFGAQIYVG